MTAPRQRSPRPQPQRPDARTFRRRRIMVLLILLMLIGGVTAGVLVIKNWLTADEPAPVEGEEEPTGPTTEELANPKDCQVDSLALDVRLPADSLPAGEPANIPMTITNIGDVPCLFDASGATLSIAITSGDDPVWSSKHCGGGLPDERILLLDVEAADTTVVAWPGTRSESGCPGEQPFAEAGTYRLHSIISLQGSTLEAEQVFGLH